MIIKQSVVDVLMFLFERYLDDEELSETSRVTDERDSIQPQDVDTHVGNEEHLFEHRAEHGRIAVIQVPLKAIERGPNPLLHPIMPGEVSSPHRWEDLT